MSQKTDKRIRREQNRIRKEVNEQLQTEAIEVVTLLKEMPWWHRLVLSIWLLFLPKAWMIDLLKRLTSKSGSSGSSTPSGHGSSGQSRPESVPKASPTVSSAGEVSSEPSRPSDPESGVTKIEDARNSKLCRAKVLR